MPLFRRTTADIAPPSEVGGAHMRLCGDLCAGVDAASTDLNAPLPAAVEALPKSSLLKWDQDPKDTSALMMGTAIHGPRGTSSYQRYIWGHSIFRAAYDAGARGDLPRIAARMAATNLKGVVETAIEHGRTEFGLLTGYEQLKQLGEILEDYEILSAAEAMSLLAQLHRRPEDKFEQEISRILEMRTRENLAKYIKLVRERMSADDEATRYTLKHYEQIAQGAT
jgi:hypothetical protein